MIIVLLLFFKSICLYCQRLVLHIHDRWINPKNVRIIREAAEAKGVKIIPEEYRSLKKSKKRRYAHAASNSGAAVCSPSSGPSALLSSLGSKVENCHFCANTPQGYCRHHFHLQELYVHRQQQKIWCPLGGGFSNRSVEYKQLRKIKRDLKRTLHQQSTKLNYSYSGRVPLYSSTVTNPAPEESLNSFNDSGYQSNSVTSSQLAETNQENADAFIDSQEFLDLPSPDSMVETTYSFKSCRESPKRLNTPLSPATLSRDKSTNSFLSCETSSISTSYL